MCDLRTCEDDPTHYVVTRTLGLGPGGRPLFDPERRELCTPHYDLALKLAESKVTKLVDHGPLYTGLRVVK